MGTIFESVWVEILVVGSPNMCMPFACRDYSLSFSFCLRKFVFQSYCPCSVFCYNVWFLQYFWILNSGFQFYVNSPYPYVSSLNEISWQIWRNFFRVRSLWRLFFTISWSLIEFPSECCYADGYISPDCLGLFSSSVSCSVVIFSCSRGHIFFRQCLLKRCRRSLVKSANIF